MHYECMKHVIEICSTLRFCAHYSEDIETKKGKKKTVSEVGKVQDTGSYLFSHDDFRHFFLIS